MFRAYRYRLYPNRQQAAKLESHLELCRELYNAALMERIGAYKSMQKSIGPFDQQKQLKDVRQIRPEFQNIRFIVLNEVLFRLDKAFQSFFRRIKKGEKPGFPRFKGRRWYNSLSFTKYAYRVEGNCLILGKVGGIKINLHRPLPKTCKTCIVKRSCGAWYAIIFCEVAPCPLPQSDQAIGIDVGLESFAVLSNGEHVANPRWYQKAQAKLRVAQRRVARRIKGSHHRSKAVLLLAKMHEHICNQRRDFHHKLSHRIVNEFGTIAVEALNVKGLAAGILSRQVTDAGWASFLTKLAYKAESASRRIIAIHPAGTSQTCLCGASTPKRLSDREHVCATCGLVGPRDLVSAKLILKWALEKPSGANVGAVMPSVAREIYANI